MDLTRSTLWQEIAKLCPMNCQISHIGQQDYVDTVDEHGIPCKRARFNFVQGVLTVQEVQHGWIFFHPGLKDGKLFIHALNGDTSPGYSNVHIRN